MMDRVGSSFDAAQQFEALRGYRPGGSKTTSVFRQALQEKLVEPPQPKIAEPPKPVAPPQPEAVRWEPPPPPVQPQLSPQFKENALQPMLQDVAQVAKDMGYVGVTTQDVLRAYRSGQSFLADYTV